MPSNYNTDFLNSLPDNSRVWVYQANRELTDAEVAAATEQMKLFVQQWSSHSREVIASGSIIYNRFLVLVADETQFQVSGCSIDSSVHFVKELGSNLGVDFFDRLGIAYKMDDEVQVSSRKEFTFLIDSGAINWDTVVFNNMVLTKGQFLQKWEGPLSESWHAKTFGNHVH